MVFILQIRSWTLPEAEQLIHNHTLRKGQRQGLKLTTLVSRFSQCPLPRVSSDSLLLPEPEEVRIEGRGDVRAWCIHMCRSAESAPWKEEGKSVAMVTHNLNKTSYTDYPSLGHHHTPSSRQ